jgi:hypothetical protein
VAETEVISMISYILGEVRDRARWLIHRGWRDGTPCD